MTKDLKDRLVLVTGASRGLGYALADAAGAAGAHVIALARTVGGLEELDDLIKAAGGQATLVPLDLTDDPGLERLGGAIHERWGKLDLWFHTAVQAPPLAPVEHIDAKELDRSIRTNFRAVQRLIRVLDPLLRRSDDGQAVFFRNGHVEGRAHHATYRAVMAARDDLVTDWGRSLAAVGAGRVDLLDAPPMRTALRARFYPGEPVARLASPADVARDMLARL